MQILSGFVFVAVLASPMIMQGQVEGIPVEQELTITHKERMAIDKLKVILGPKLKYDYMKQDLYILRWLRATDLDLKKAEIRFMDNLKFREENRMDTIMNEDWSDMEVDYPYSVDTQDKEGRPIVAFSLGDWDLRKGLLQGKRDRVIRYMDKGFEEASIQIRQKQARGENVTQAIFLIDLTNFNLVQHGCFQCLPTIYQYFQHQIYYPNLPDKIILTNTPGLFETVLQLLGPIMAPETRVALRVFGPEKDKWRSYLYSLVDRDQLYTEFGGTRSH